MNNILLYRIQYCPVTPNPRHGDMRFEERHVFFQFLLQVFLIPSDGKNVFILLGRKNEISRPTRVRTDKDGKRPVVVYKNGNELRNYEITTVRKIAI